MNKVEPLLGQWAHFYVITSAADSAHGQSLHLPRGHRRLTLLGDGRARLIAEGAALTLEAAIALAIEESIVHARSRCRQELGDFGRLHFDGGNVVERNAARERDECMLAIAHGKSGKRILTRLGHECC